MDFFNTVGALGLGSRLRRLGDRLIDEARIIYDAAGVDFEPRWFPLFFLLQERGQITVTETATTLDLPHPYISQLVKEMRHAKLIRFKRHPEDGRSRILVLSSKGSALVNVLKPLWEDIDEAVHTIIRSTGSNVLATLESMERLLVDMPLSQLVQARRDSRAVRKTERTEVVAHRLDTVHIRPIERNDDPAIAEVIRAVMTEFGASGPGFSIHDNEVDYMSQAYTGPGKQYFVVTRDGHVVGGGGVAQLAGADASLCELKKMYFLPEARGTGAGRALLERCLDAAWQFGYARCYLETLRSMGAAHRLYERAGFTRIAAPLGNTGHYSCDIFYVKDLRPNTP